MFDFHFSNQFKKDLKVAEKRRCNMNEMTEIIAKIIFEEPLPERCRPHNLSGNWSNFTNNVFICITICHIKIFFYVETK